MITFNLYQGKRLHPSSYFQNQPRTTEEALCEIVKIFSHDIYYPAWVEDIQPEGGNSIIKVGHYGMAGEKWISVYQGDSVEVLVLAEVCTWFYRATGKASDKFKKMMLREEESSALSPIIV